MQGFGKPFRMLTLGAGLATPSTQPRVWHVVRILAHRACRAGVACILTHKICRMPLWPRALRYLAMGWVLLHALTPD